MRHSFVETAKATSKTENDNETIRIVGPPGPNGASCSGHVRDQGTQFNLSSVRKVGKHHTLRPSRKSRFIRLSPSCCEDRAKQPDTLQALRKITGHGWQALSLVLSKTLQVNSAHYLSRQADLLVNLRARPSPDPAVPPA